MLMTKDGPNVLANLCSDVFKAMTLDPNPILQTAYL